MSCLLFMRSMAKKMQTDQLEFSQLEQVSQAAALAEEEGYEDEVILAAFFHNRSGCANIDDENALMTIKLGEYLPVWIF